METPFPLLALCEGNQSTTGDSSHKEPVMRSFDNSFVADLNQIFNKQSICLWEVTEMDRSYL